ncbi:MAG: TetR/AcrR family transcriptional regulator [Gammaproteobacteria bacterium]|nr:TetR/AcrR family transcriptional regulator [Gammaproteobacteria bacterium]
MPSIPVKKRNAEKEPALKVATLDRLRLAARELFVELGYHETRPQDVARLAGVANGTFYLHFADKQQAFLDFAEQAQNELLEVMSDRLQEISGSRARWRVTCGAVVDFGAEHPGLLQAAFLDPVFIAPRDDNAWRMYDRLGHLVSITVRNDRSTDSTGDQQDEFDFELISHGLCGLLRHAMIYASRRDLNREKMIEDLSMFIDRGLGNR